MRIVFLSMLLNGCAVLHDAGNELKKDVTGVQSEFARLYLKEKSQ